MSIQAGTVISAKSLKPISQEQLQQYAEASGDFNPIHLDEKVAKKVGLPGVIAHGMLMAAFLAERAREFVEKESTLQGFRLAQSQTRFKAMTFLGDIPSVGGTVKEFDSQTLVLELYVKNQKGEVTTTGLARFESMA